MDTLNIVLASAWFLTSLALLAASRKINRLTREIGEVRLRRVADFRRFDENCTAFQKFADSLQNRLRELESISDRIRHAEKTIRMGG